MLHLPIIEYSRHLETQKVLLFILGVAVATSCLTQKEKFEIALGGKGTYFALSLRQAVFTRAGETKTIPLLDYLSSVVLGKRVVVDRRKVDRGYGATYGDRYYQVIPIERRATFSRASFLTSGRSHVYEVTDPKNQTTVLVAAVGSNPIEIVRQAHLSIQSRYH